MIVSAHSIWIYPVKSFAGTEVNQATLTPKGILGDRIWMVVKACGKMLTQRQAPQMACFHAKYEDPEHPFESSIIVTDTRDNTHITVPPPNTHNIVTQVHKDECQSHVASDIANAWITQKLNTGSALKLVQFDQNQTRKTQDPRRFGDNATHFADAAPYLIVNKHAVDLVNRHLTYDHENSNEPSKQNDRVSIAHFRPNIVIQGLRAFDEHSLKTLSPDSAPINNNKSWQLSLIDHCQRCSIITNNPKTGVMNKKSSIFTVLTQLNPMPSNLKAPAFGVNACLKIYNDQITHTLIKGDPLYIG